MIIDGMHYSEECSCQNCREITTRHRINRRVLEKETMNEPQLSAEMEKRFDEEFGYLSVAIDYYVENAYPLRKESGMKHLRDIKHFLATALEEQNKRFLSQLKERKYLISKDGMAEEYLQELINDYEDILNGKGE